MGLLTDNFVLTHISLKCLFTKKWKIEREKDKEIQRNENKWTKNKMGLQLCCATQKKKKRIESGQRVIRRRMFVSSVIFFFFF